MAFALEPDVGDELSGGRGGHGRSFAEEIVMMVADRELTPAEIRGELPAEPTLATVAYHLAILERAGLFERVGGVCRRKL